jgi:hypothetical protein
MTLSSINFHSVIVGQRTKCGLSRNHRNRKLRSAKLGPTVNLRCTNADPRLSESGQTLPSQDFCGTAASPPETGHCLARLARPKSAISGCEQSQQTAVYSINSSARPSRVGGRMTPRVLAVLKLITRRNFVTRLGFPACDAVDALTLSSLGLGDQPRFRFGFGLGFAFDRLGLQALLVPAFDHVCPRLLEWAHAKLSQCDLGLGLPLGGRRARAEGALSKQIVDQEDCPKP